MFNFNIRNKLKKINFLRKLVQKLRLPYSYLFLKYFFSYLPHSFLSKIELLIITAQGRGEISFPYVLREEINSCLALVKNPKTIIDIGANIGLYTQHLHKKFPSAEYFLFEPSKVNADILTKKFNFNNKIQVFNKAASNYNGKSELFSVTSGNPLNSLIKQDFFHDEVTKFNFSEETEVVRLDSQNFFKKLEKIDYIKIDTEGNEYNVLEGLGKDIKKCKLIQFEFGMGTLYAKKYFLDFWNFFKKKDFSLYIITPAGPKLISEYSYKFEHFDVINFIALNNNL